jgi:hypothetical protein
MAARSKPKRPRDPIAKATELAWRAYRLLEGRSRLQWLARELVEALLKDAPMEHAPILLPVLVTMQRDSARTVFLESCGRYDAIFSTTPPSKFAQFVERVPMLRGRLDEKGSTGTFNRSLHPS